jgi:malic enzyme
MRSSQRCYRNEVLYYKLLQDHLEEMLPVVCDPVVAMITYVDRRPLSRARSL